MAIVSGSDRKIVHAEDVRALYAPAGAGNGKVGLEVELAFFFRDTGAFMDREAHARLMHGAAERGVTLNVEPFCDGVEIATLAAPFARVGAVIGDAQRQIGVAMEAARALGLKRSFFEHSPQVSPDDLLRNIVDIERFRTFFDPPRPDMTGIARYFVGSKSTQVSVSYETEDHLMRNMRRLAFLAPFLFLLCENTCRFYEGREEPADVHPGMDYRAALGKLGGIPDYVFTARTGAEMVDAHIKSVFDAPLFTFFDESGKQRRLPDREWTSFRALAERGLNTERNYFLAQSTLWRDIAIRPLRDAAGNTTGHRLEARMFGVGMHQHATAAMITGGLAFDEKVAAETDRLLERFGFHIEEPGRSRAALDEAYRAARNRGGRFFGIACGTGIMADFARDFAAIMEAAFGDDTHVAPLLHICRTGMTDSRVNRERFGSLREIAAFQKSYDESWFDGFSGCNDLAFRDGGSPCLKAGCI